MAARSGALANSKASRQSFAAARPIRETPPGSSSPGARNFVFTRRWVMVVGSHAANTSASSSAATGGACRSAASAGAAAPPTAVARTGKRIGQLVDENQLRLADADDVARLQQPVAADHLVADDRAVAAVQVAECPLAARNEHLDVVPAAPLVLQDDLAGRRPADGDRLTRHQPEHVAPLRSLADH